MRMPAQYHMYTPAEFLANFGRIGLRAVFIVLNGVMHDNRYKIGIFFFHLF